MLAIQRVGQFLGDIIARGLAARASAVGLARIGVEFASLINSHRKAAGMTRVHPAYPFSRHADEFYRV